jgi:hypothetical protein
MTAVDPTHEGHAVSTYAEVFLSGKPISDHEITEWLLDAKDYIPQLEGGSSNFRALARFIQAAVLIIEQLQRAEAS